ncbi:hypothetical protein EW146_g5210 [Bondarzewia mesenterica]|uniref:AAA+ ATPase domain-containing protein n=1 Tax=Bondarzewia mesenterica TaxID=1095465 RepID=A0A4S4LT71_9AGAM|nr:hypothetical protein EW146_g5210 [Bondarzewia mesenterica]
MQYTCLLSTTLASILQLTTVLQPLLAALSNGSISTTPTLNGTLPGNATMPISIPTDISSLLTFITSFSAFRDWAKLFLIGALLEACRRLYSSSYSSIIDQFFITANFESEDVVFDWMMFWLSSLPAWRKVREFTVSTSSLGLSNGDEATILEVEENDEDGLPAVRKTRSIKCLPSCSASYSIWHNRHWIRITRQKEESRWYSDKSMLQITIFSRDRAVLDGLILEAKKAYLAARDDKIDIFVNEGYSSDWRHIASRPKRPLKSIILDAGVKELILNDAKDFLKSKQWYADRGIPFRRGYLLYGAPGSGKTSIIHSLAGELGLDIYIISLSKSGLDDTTLNSLISALPEQCIALMEDIDAAFTHGLTRDSTGTELHDPRDPARPKDPNDESDLGTEGGRRRGTEGNKDSVRITLSGLLNALDGVSAQEGRLLFATTNCYGALDAALTRPGRMDLHVEFKLASQYQAREMFRRFYVPDDDMESDKEERDDEEVKADIESIDSGYGTPTKKSAGDLIDLSQHSPSSPSSSSSSSDSIVDSTPNYSGLAHSSRAPVLTKKQVERLATRFADSVPDREFSMASLQGYLMNYKIRPVQAVEDVARWVDDKRQERAKKRQGSKMGVEQANKDKPKTDSAEVVVKEER